MNELEVMKIEISYKLFQITGSTISNKGRLGIEKKYFLNSSNLSNLNDISKSIFLFRYEIFRDISWYLIFNYI